MSDRTFLDAYARVRARHDAQSWLALSPREIANSIYNEIRMIDRERVALESAVPRRIAIAAE